MSKSKKKTVIFKSSDEITRYHIGRNCSQEQYKCDNLQCIDSKYACDGKSVSKFQSYSSRNCIDGSDETHCEEFECESDYWKCSDNLKCIPAEYVCDLFVWVKERSCLDGSDEHAKVCGCPEVSDVNTHTQ